MTHESLTPSPSDARIGAALTELEQFIQERYPDATFTTFRGEEPDGMYLRVTIDQDDPDEVVDHVLDRLYELQVEQALPVYVIAVPPLARIAKALHARSDRPTFPVATALPHG